MAGPVKFNQAFVAAESAREIAKWFEQSNESHKALVEAARALNSALSCTRSLLTPSGSAALEMMPLIYDFEPGDEIIMPSYTFTTSASAFALRGVTPVFVDVGQKNLCLTAEAVEPAITAKTKAILAVHYGGWCDDIVALKKLAELKGLLFFEDAAQALGSTFEATSLGCFGHWRRFLFMKLRIFIALKAGLLWSMLMMSMQRPKECVKRAQIAADFCVENLHFTPGPIWGHPTL